MLFILILTTLLAILIVKQYQKSRKLPPGPIAFPLIGNIPQLVYQAWRNKGIVPAFEHFRKTYGNVFTIWMGPFPHISIADYETNHEVFVKNGNRYKQRFLAPIFEECNEGHGLVFANGEIWAEMRRFTMLTFRNMGVGRDIMQERVLEEIDARCDELDATAVNGQTVIQHSEFFELMVGSMINSLLVGKRFEAHNQPEFFHIRHLLDKLNEFFTIFDMIVPVWFLKKFFPKRYEATRDGMNAIADYVGKVAEQRVKDVKSGKYILDEENPKDFVDAFLIKMEQENKNGGHPAYTMKSLKFVLSDLWSAGHDTTATTLTSGFNQLVNHPEVVRKIRNELMRITDNGSRRLTLQDRTETHYLNATIAEIQRHASILNVNFWKVSDSPTTINGYQLDSGEILTAQVSAIHVNEDIFKDAGKFDPERFIENEKLIHQIIPFGIGKRSCVGENIARTNLYLMLGNLLLRYDIQPHEKLPSTADQLPFSSAKIPDKSAKIQFIKL
uniref:CYtochrome P450 family n=1 Tax=Caenorhabditis tropicalis TaxID=1561998 RepID=A0A1I7TXU7_9PELO